jgi:hypothetical protein
VRPHTKLRIPDSARRAGRLDDLERLDGDVADPFPISPLHARLQPAKNPSEDVRPDDQRQRRAHSEKDVSPQDRRPSGGTVSLDRGGDSGAVGLRQQAPIDRFDGRVLVKHGHHASAVRENPGRLWLLLERQRRRVDSRIPRKRSDPLFEARRTLFGRVGGNAPDAEQHLAVHDHRRLMHRYDLGLAEWALGSLPTRALAEGWDGRHHRHCKDHRGVGEPRTPHTRPL